jgi:hypothetical protein
MKVLKMKKAAEIYRLQNAKAFENREAYLEYVIEAINLQPGIRFHQYLFLIDVLYLIIDDDVTLNQPSAKTTNARRQAPRQERAKQSASKTPTPPAPPTSRILKEGGPVTPPKTPSAPSLFGDSGLDWTNK